MSFLAIKNKRLKEQQAKIKTPLADAIKRANDQQENAEHKTPLAVQEGAIEGNEELILNQFKDDVLTLREFEEVEKKIDFKRSVLLPGYLSFAYQAMKEDNAELDEIVVWCAMWCLDVGNIAEGVELALYACDKNLDTPLHFKGDAQSFFTTEFIKWAKPKIQKGESVEPFYTQWLDAAEKWQEINQIEEGNLYKWAGEIEHRAEKFKEALAYYEKATKINERAGCKERMKAAKANNKL